MGRPINSRYIGPSTGPDDDKIRGYGVYANLGDGIIDSVILQQRSTSKFLIAPSNNLDNTMVAQLVNSDEPDVGQFFIDLIDTNDQRIKVRKLTNRRVYTADGSSYTWKLNVNGQVNIGNTELTPINIELFAMVIDTTLGSTTFTIRGRYQSDIDKTLTIDWGDGTEETVTDTISSDNNFEFSHTYVSNGVYVVSFSGAYTSLNFSDANEITEITSFGKNNVDNFSLENTFSRCANISSLPPSLPENIGPFLALFGTSSIDNTIRSDFNTPNISSWDLNAIDADLSGGVFIDHLFQNATNYNQPLNDWDVSSVVGMSNLFLGATSFNQPLNNWDVSNVANMNSMFQDATSFNQPLNNWDVRNVTNMNRMFQDASSFDQDLGNWQLDSIQFIGSMLSGSNISLENYTRTLIGWANHLFTLDSPPENVTIDNNDLFGSTITFNDIVGEFNDLASAKNYLESTLNWTINDGDAVRAVFDNNASFEADTTLTTGNTVDGVDQVLIREFDLFGLTTNDVRLTIYHSEPAASPFNIVNQNGVWITNA